MEIKNKQEYYNTIINILEECFNCTNNKNEIIDGIKYGIKDGIKNKDQSYEKKIEDILKKYCNQITKNNNINIDDNNNIFLLNYEYQPFGSQRPPDFMLSCNNYENIKIECKSSKNNKPVWNCSIPDEKTIYLYYDTSNDKTYIFNGDKIVNPAKIEKIKELHNTIKKLCDEFNKEYLIDEYVEYYPRQMINQKKKIENIGNQYVMFDEVKIKLKNIILNNNLDNKK